MSDVFRCSLASRADGEPMAGTAPPESSYLFLEYAGAWGAKALAESRLPERVRERLGALDGVRVQLVRRFGGLSGPGVRVFAARLDATGGRVTTGVLDRAEDVLDLDLDALEAGRDCGLEPYAAPLWMVCTNGRRDLCCAEQGRPVAAALSAGWPEETWETSHLGGHRFAATLLALPSGLTLGGLDTESAPLAVEEVLAGRHPVGFSRGRAGLAPAAQVAQRHVVETSGEDRLDAVVVTGQDPDDGGGVVRVDLLVRDDPWQAEVQVRPGPPRAQSCGVDVQAKPTTRYEVLRAAPAGSRPGG